MCPLARSPQTPSRFTDTRTRTFAGGGCADSFIPKPQYNGATSILRPSPHSNQNFNNNQSAQPPRRFLSAKSRHALATQYFFEPARYGCCHAANKNSVNGRNVIPQVSRGRGKSKPPFRPVQILVIYFATHRRQGYAPVVVKLPWHHASKRIERMPD